MWRISLALTMAGSHSNRVAGRSEEGGGEDHYSGAGEAMKRIAKVYSSTDKSKIVHSQVFLYKSETHFSANRITLLIRRIVLAC